MKKFLWLLAVSVVSFVSCKKDRHKVTIFKGTESSVFHGKAQGVYEIDPHGLPYRLSLSLDDNLLNSAPLGGTHTDEVDFIINLPKEAKEQTLFQHIMLNWNPAGHEPPGIYDIPHFDIHFYTVPDHEVHGYTDMTKMENFPAASYLPSTYFPGPAIPKMGKHWIDTNTPELNGQVFTETMIYGTYDSRLIFVEPMITLNFLKTKNYYEREIAQPSKYQRSGYYPTKMSVRKYNKKTEVSLTHFVYRQAS
jgi:hypothetical protein